MPKVPVIVLVGIVAVPFLLSEVAVRPKADHNAAHPGVTQSPRYFWAGRSDGAAHISPTRAAAQIKRVAAARNIPYVTVRQMVENNARGRDIDVAALNRALDAYHPAQAR
jgi:hypothetical protein